MIAINEVFGPTVQGEGPSMGELAAFIRLAACNLYCSWCDTPYTWDWTGRNGVKFSVKNESHPRTVDEVMDWTRTMKRAGVGLFVITGGEPLLQRAGLITLIEALVRDDAQAVEIETNGTQDPLEAAWWSDALRFNVSPKLSNSGIPSIVRYRPVVLQEFVKTQRASFKFVTETVADLAEVGSMVEDCRIPRDRVWIMPQARTAEELFARTRTLAPAAAARGYNFSSRLQVIAWGAARGH